MRNEIRHRPPTNSDHQAFAFLRLSHEVISLLLQFFVCHLSHVNERSV
jgi:hypothetical protein